MFATVVRSMIQKLKLASSIIASVPLFIFEFSLRLNSTSFSPASELFGSTYLKHTIYQDYIWDLLRMFSKPSILTAPQFGISTSRGTLQFIPSLKACSSTNIHQLSDSVVCPR